MHAWLGEQMDTRRPDFEYDALVDRLMENFGPARRIWPVNRRLTAWLILQLAILGLVAGAAPRMDLPGQLRNPQYLLQLAAFVVTGAIAAWLALRTAIPSREAKRAELVIIGIAAVIAIFSVRSGPAGVTVPWGQFIRAGSRCLICTTLLAAPPWFVLFWAVRRGAPFAVKTAGGLIGAAAFCFAFTASRLGCAIDSPSHLLVWHVLPIVAGTVVSLRAGRRLAATQEQRPARAFLIAARSAIANQRTRGSNAPRQ